MSWPHAYIQHLVYVELWGRLGAGFLGACLRGCEPHPAASATAVAADGSRAGKRGRFRSRGERVVARPLDITRCSKLKT